MRDAAVVAPDPGAVVFRVHEDDIEPDSPRGAQDPYRDLSAVGYQYRSLAHYLVFLPCVLEAVLRSRCWPGYVAGFIRPPERLLIDLLDTCPRQPRHCLPQPGNLPFGDAPGQVVFELGKGRRRVRIEHHAGPTFISLVRTREFASIGRIPIHAAINCQAGRRLAIGPGRAAPPPSGRGR